MRLSLLPTGLLIWALISPLALGREHDFSVLPADQSSALYDHLLRDVDQQTESRSRAVEQALTSPEALAARQEMLRSAFRGLIGPLPERTPLNARTVGTIDCEGYRIERVIFESRPRHHVTANLYLPADTSRPVPGVLVPCGHSANGKASEAYQSVCILLALNGCAALIYDPIGQGERHQLADPIGHGTNEHTLVGVGALLVGLNTGHYRIWDGLRSMDYLASRPEVDPARLGCTGNSGGGTMTTWLMAADDRIAVAAPSCFVTTLERLFKTIGPQDCEQHFPGQGPLGIDHTDFITMRAPKPTLILAAEKDYFDFGGTRTAAKEAVAVYRVLGHPERTGLFSFGDEHGFSQPRRQAAVHWMRRWLAGDDRPVAEPTLALQTDAALQVTGAGQVLKEFADEETVVDFNKQRAAALRQERASAWASLGDEAKQGAICQTLNIAEPTSAASNATAHGSEEAASWTVEKFVISGKDGFPLPALLFRPKGDPAKPNEDSAKRPLTLYADSAGKAAGLGTEGPIEQLLTAGRQVLAVDLRGYGETADSRKAGAKYQNDAFRTAMLAMQVGRPLVGQRVEDLLAAIHYGLELPTTDPQDVRILAVGRAGPVALHAAVLDTRVTSLELRNSIRSWETDVVARSGDSQLLELAVPGALARYDLGDLAALLGDRLKSN